MTDTIAGATVVGFNPITIKGDKGDTGATPSFAIGGVTTLLPGSAATATITGSPVAPVLNLGIPQGADGGSLDLPGGWSGTVGTRRSNYIWGCGGQGTSTSWPDAHMRLPVLLPVTTTQWRLRISNTTPSGVAQTGVVSFTGVYTGSATVDSTGTPTGSFTAAPVQALSSFASNNDGSDVVTPWVTSQANQFTARTMGLLSIGWTKTAGMTVVIGSSSMFVGSGTGASAEAGVQTATIGFSTIGQVAFNINLEYEFVGTQKVGVALGDSITEGQVVGFSYNAWHQRYSMRTGIPMACSGAFGTSSNTWQSSSTLPLWTKIRNAGLTIDFAVIMLGVNDIALSRALATYQGFMQTIIGTTKALGIRDVYLSTVSPRSAVGTVETTRTAYNGWIGGTAIAGVAGAFLINEALFSYADATVLQSVYDSGDHLHWNSAGHLRAASVIPKL